MVNATPTPVQVLEVFCATNEARLTLVNSIKTAYDHLGLKSGQLDFGTVGRDPETGQSLSVVLYEFGLLDDTATEFWTLVDLQGRPGPLYAGNGLLFATDHEGETIDIPPQMVPVLLKSLCFFHSREAAEQAILDGRVRRPESSINGTVLWSWHANGGQSHPTEGPL